MRVLYNQHIFSHYRQGIIDRLLAATDMEVHLAGDTVDPFGTGIKGATIHEGDRFVRLPSLVYRGGFLRQPGLGRVLRQLQPDAAIFCGDARFLSVWAQARALRRRGGRVLFWTHGWLTRPRGLVGRVRHAFYDLADALLLYGDRAKAIGVADGFAPERLHVIYNSLDYPRQNAIREAVTEAELLALRSSLFGETETPVVICTARLTPNRGLDLLLDSLRRLKAQGYPVHCLLVGEGPERGALEGYAAEHQLSVRFYGPCYDEPTLARLFMVANACVSPGWIGLTAIHSLTYGTPVITHDNAAAQGPEWEAVTDAETGALFRQHDVDDLATRIQAWTASARVTPEVRERCRQVIARRYNPDVQLKVLRRAVQGLPAEDTAWQRWADKP
jgi:glycosyltransferase involved in cell wall biosynthesis